MGDEVALTCAECGAPVQVDDERIVRSCGHEEAAVTASVSAEMKGAGGLR